MRRSSVDKVRENLRLQQVYNTLLRYGTDVLFDRWPVIGDFRRTMQAWAWGLPKDLDPPTLPVKVRLMLEELGPTYVKVGQIVSSQASTIPSDWEAELEKLQSDVPPFPNDQVRQIIIEELGAPPEELYATFPTALCRGLDRAGASSDAARRHHGRGEGAASLHQHANEG
jgi:ubiquinone biosynthesis protein